MPEIATRQFGRLEFSESSVVSFPCGLPGFETCTRFLLIERPAVAPVCFLQSVDSPALCFCIAPVLAVDPQYQLAMTEEDERLVQPSETTVCFAILTSTEKGEWSANLAAPVVIDMASRRAVQAVRADSKYSHRHPLGGSPC
jgi:flagellar assembly factor FliW